MSSNLSLLPLTPPSSETSRSSPPKNPIPIPCQIGRKCVLLFLCTNCRHRPKSSCPTCKHILRCQRYLSKVMVDCHVDEKFPRGDERAIKVRVLPGVNSRTVYLNGSQLLQGEAMAFREGDVLSFFRKGKCDCRGISPMAFPSLRFRVVRNNSESKTRKRKMDHDETSKLPPEKKMYSEASKHTNLKDKDVLYNRMKCNDCNPPPSEEGEEEYFSSSPNLTMHHFSYNEHPLPFSEEETVTATPSQSNYDIFFENTASKDVLTTARDKTDQDIIRSLPEKEQLLNNDPSQILITSLSKDQIETLVGTYPPPSFRCSLLRLHQMRRYPELPITDVNHCGHAEMNDHSHPELLRGTMIRLEKVAGSGVRLDIMIS